MKENGAKVVADAVLGEDLKFVTIGKEVYAIKPPSIKVILSAIRYLTKVKLGGDNHTKVSILSEYPKNTGHITRALAVLINGKDDRHFAVPLVKHLFGRKTEKLAKKLENGTFHEILTAYQYAIQMMGGDDFFALAQLAKNLQKVAARPK